MVNGTLHIVIERAINLEHTTYHINRRLIDISGSIHFTNNSGAISVTGTTPGFNIEPFAIQIAEELFEIPGVGGGRTSGGISVGDHSINVSRGRAFDENDIDFAVLEMLARLFNVALNDVTYDLDNSNRQNVQSFLTV